MLVKRAYINVQIRNAQFKYESQLRLGWRVGLVGIAKVNDKWNVIHIPTGTIMSGVTSFVQGKGLAQLFNTYGISAKTTLEDVKTDPLWPSMQKAYNQWHHGHN